MGAKLWDVAGPAGTPPDPQMLFEKVAPCHHLGSIRSQWDKKGNGQLAHCHAPSAPVSGNLLAGEKHQEANESLEGPSRPDPRSFQVQEEAEGRCLARTLQEEDPGLPPAADRAGGAGREWELQPAWWQGLWTPNASRTAHEKWLLVGLPEFYKGPLSFFCREFARDRAPGRASWGLSSWVSSDGEAVRPLTAGGRSGSLTSRDEQKRKEGDCQPVNVGQNNTVTVQTEVERRRWPQQVVESPAGPARRDPGRPLKVRHSLI
ncbi:uncharacterized protein LOC115499160 [Lynx canadensis]|uniref:uncharacterized protein LOC115499160 n=1 Tax=Lynx canadensis TaxID=61383 RepID=UPI0011B06E60|nr:uncharacterized protein LOC115499160 [Lynx canadensis]